ncbi:MAG TPA: type II toxin-antitoxin system RelE/ParE family toxin [Chthoniobacteraceae bacterium]|nr:type II toxin-antitoxin system RelE/ParE family toxin [Chthoniobacteraceae bacterium]
MFDLIFLAGAEFALQEIYNSLEERESGRGDRFLEVLDGALTQVRTFPRSGSPFHRSYRRLLIPGHRYGIIYSIEGRRVVVTRLVDLRQNPESIRRGLD